MLKQKLIMLKKKLIMLKQKLIMLKQKVNYVEAAPTLYPLSEKGCLCH